jgi:hypothetical protein
MNWGYYRVNKSGNYSSNYSNLPNKHGNMFLQQINIVENPPCAMCRSFCFGNQTAVVVDMMWMYCMAFRIGTSP